MYVPDIHSLPLHLEGPASPDQPGRAVTSAWSLMDDGLIQIGVTECTQGVVEAPSVDLDEMVFVAAGRCTLAHGDHSNDLAPGSTLVRPRGLSGTWNIHQTLRGMYVKDHRPAAPAPAAHLGNAYTWDIGTKKSHPKPLAGDPKQILRELWVHNGLEVGIWECEPGSFGISRDGYDEAMVILGGRATMHATNGQIFALQAGSVLLTPEGFVGHWVIEETIRKVYVKVMRSR